MVFSFGFIIICVIIVAIVVKGAVIVNSGSVKLVETLGKYDKTLEPGFHVIIPFIQQVRGDVYTKKDYISKMQTVIKVDEQAVTTKDNVNITLDEEIKYSVEVPFDYIYANNNSVKTMISDVRSLARSIIGNMDLDEVLSGSAKINSDLFEQLGNKTMAYGIKVESINIGSIKTSAAIENAMEKILTASREAKAVKIEAEAQSFAIAQLAEANYLKSKKESDAKLYETSKAAEGEAIRITEVARAETIRIRVTNDAINDSYLSPQALKYLDIDARKSMANGSSNTILLSSNDESINDIVTAAEAWENTVDKKRVPFDIDNYESMFKSMVTTFSKENPSDVSDETPGDETSNIFKKNEQENFEQLEMLGDNSFSDGVSEDDSDDSEDGE